MGGQEGKNHSIKGEESGMCPGVRVGRKGELLISISPEVFERPLLLKKGGRKK